MGFFDNLFGKKKAGSSPDTKSPPKEATADTNPAKETNPTPSVANGGAQPLKKTASSDDRAPAVDQSATTKPNPMSAIGAELKDKAAEYKVAEAQREVLADVTKMNAPELKTADTSDRSAPIIESDVKLKMNPMDELKKELVSSQPDLKHVETDDHSAPKVEAGIKVKESPMAALQKEIAEKKADITSFATTGAARVAGKEVIADIAKVNDMSGFKHVDPADRSAPMIEADVKLKPSPMPQLKKELEGSNVQLKHVETADHSAPIVAPDVRVQPSPMLALQKEIADKQAEITDFAAQGGVKVVKESVLSEVTHAPELKHVEVADRSAPMIEADVKLKPSPMPQLTKELTGSNVQLKHVETADHSAPVIDSNVTLKKSSMPALVDEIKRKASQDGGK